MKTRTTKAIAVLYFLFGMLLSWNIPRQNSAHAQQFRDWDTSTSLLVRLFHVPGYMWLLPFVITCIVLLLLAQRIKGKALAALNISSFVCLVILVAHFLDLFTMFIFCHEWGCSGGYLPTWNLLR